MAHQKGYIAVTEGGVVIKTGEVKDELLGDTVHVSLLGNRLQITVHERGSGIYGECTVVLSQAQLRRLMIMGIQSLNVVEKEEQ